MTHENDPTRHLTCYVSFDPAVDRAAMGDDVVKHFGCVGDHRTQRFGNRDPKLLKFVPGRRASLFVLRPLDVWERVACDAHGTIEARWITALSYALVRCEVAPPLATVAEAYTPQARGEAMDRDALSYLAARVSYEALYEIGAVAHARSKLDFFGEGFAPLPPTSALAHVQLLRLLADTLAREASDKAITDAASTPPATPDPAAPPTSDAPGDATALEPVASP